MKAVLTCSSPIVSKRFYVSKWFMLAVIILFAKNLFSQVPTITSIVPTSAAKGTKDTITGTNFTGATAVNFGGVPASSFTVVSATRIIAVVPLAASGSVSVTTPIQTASKTGFYYLPLSGIITDYTGYWSTTTANNNPVWPDDSHNLLAFTYNDTTYSTGVNDAVLTGQGISYNPGNFRALPVANVIGLSSAPALYLAMGSKVDGSAAVAIPSALAGTTVRSVLTDGPNGLNLGTGITNLPATAIMTFGLRLSHPAKIADGEPDVIITQIAQPSMGNDIFSFVNASGVLIGNIITQDMTLLSRLGTYNLDLFALSPTSPLNSAVCYNAFVSTPTREIRLVGFKLSDFGITQANYADVAFLKVTPSSQSDYAFIAYSDAIDMYPNIAPFPERSNVSICAGGTANLEVIASSAYGGALTYVWKESADSGSTWSTVSDGGNYSGATTNRLSVTSAVNKYQYKASVTESGTGHRSSTDSAGSIGSVNPFIIKIIATSSPTNITLSPSNGTTCLNSLVSLSPNVTGGNNLFYQWQTNASGSYVNIPNAIQQNYLPPVNAINAFSYRLLVSNGSGCVIFNSAPDTVTVVGISSVTPASRCDTGTVTLTATATAGTISWYTAITGGTALVTGGTYSPSVNKTTTYYVASSLSTCSAAARVPVIASISPIIWAGTNTTDWNTLSNWNCGGSPPAALPDSTTNVTIPTAPTGGRFPVITATARVRDITISPSASIIVDTTGIFEINGAIINNGTFTATKGTISIKGAAQQTIPAGAFSTNTIKNLIINNAAGVLIRGQLNLTGTYTPTAGLLTTFGYLTLKSDSSGTAKVAMGSGTYIAGNVNVERFIPQQRAWRLMTTPLTNTNTFYQSWQNNGIYEAGKGLLVTSPGGGTGIDASGNASLKIWNSTSRSLQTVYNTKVPISATNIGSADNSGYFIFIRGDRYVNNIDPNLIRKNTTTLTSTGFLQTNTQNFTNLPSTADGFFLLGNPYASPIDWNLVLANPGTRKIKRKFWVWDPKVNSVGVGGYAVVDDAITPGIFTPNVNYSSQGNYIQSSQAVYVQTDTTSGAASVQVLETNKAATSSNAIFGRPMGNGNTESLIINLAVLNTADSSAINVDGTRADFNDRFSAGIDDYDNIKFTNVNETFGIMSANVFLATERRPAVRSKDTLFLNLTKTTQRAYRFQFIPVNFIDSALTAMLEDSYTGMPVPLNLNSNTNVSFSINADASSQAAGRFRVVFRQSEVLPVSFTSVKANRQDNQVFVAWKVENEINISHYEVERSSDGISFSRINTTTATGNNLSQVTYYYIDKHVIKSDNFYRVRSIGSEGKIMYSAIVKVAGFNDRSISVYPNPVADKIMNVQFNNQPAGLYTLRINNAAGQLIMKTVFNHTGGTVTKNIHLPATLETGNYQLSVAGKDSNETFIKVFIK